MSADDTLPPVGATVTDGFGVTWTCVSSRWTTDGFTRERLWESASGGALLVEHAKDTTALWRLQQERDGLQISKNDLELHVAELLIVQGGLERRMIELQAKVARLSRVLREAVFSGIEGGVCEECGEDIRLDESWRTDENNNQWHAPTCESAVANRDAITVVSVGELSQLRAEDARLREDAERWRWFRSGGHIRPSGGEWEAYRAGNVWDADSWVCGSTMDEAVDGARAPKETA